MKHREKKTEKSAQDIGKLCSNFKQPNMCVIRVAKKEEKGRQKNTLRNKG